MSVLHHLGPYGLSELPHGTHVYHGVGALKDERLGRFPLKIDFLNILSDDMNVSILHPNTWVKVWYMGTLSNTVSINDSAWIWEGSCLDNTHMYGYLERSNNKDD